jgi:hypothetical protein
MIHALARALTHPVQPLSLHGEFVEKLPRCLCLSRKALRWAGHPLLHKDVSSCPGPSFWGGHLSLLLVIQFQGQWLTLSWHTVKISWMNEVPSRQDDHLSVYSSLSWDKALYKPWLKSNVLDDHYTPKVILVAPGQELQCELETRQQLTQVLPGYQLWPWAN